MTDSSIPYSKKKRKHTHSSPSATRDRTTRLATALRSNLSKRKQQTHARRYLQDDSSRTPPSPQHHHTHPKGENSQ